MAWYRTGTISLTNGSTAVTGAGTAFITNAGIGEALLAPDGKLYEIANIESDTSITLGSNYLGTTQSGQAYVIVPSQSYIRDLAAQAATLLNTYSSLYNSVGQGKFSDGALATPGISFTGDQDTGFYRSGSGEVTLVANGVAIAKWGTTGFTILNSASVNIDGGTIDGTVIGGTTKAAGSFTALTATGNTTLGDASTDTVQVNGYMGVGIAANPGVTLRLNGASTLTGTAQRGLLVDGTASSASTTSYSAAELTAKTQATAHTVTNVYGLNVTDATKGAGSTITNQYGIFIADQTQGDAAGINAGLRSSVTSGTNKWNIYASGSAPSYFSGNVLVGDSAPLKTSLLSVGKAASSEADPLVHIFDSSDDLGLVMWQQDSPDRTFNVKITTSDSANGSLLLGAQSLTPSIRFNTGTSATYSERMRIHASGGVSIGDTTDPGAGSLRVAGNTTFGDASTDTVTVNGYMGVGVAPQANYGMNVRHSALSGTDIAGVLSVPTASASHATARAHYGRVDTPVSAFTVGRTAVFEALDGTKGAGSTITNQNGVYIPDLTVGTNNYGITSAVAASPVSRTITNVQVTSNVVTVTTSVAHGLMIGETPTVTATTNTGINGAALITGTPTTTTFTYAKTLADIASVADTGTVALTRNKWNIYASGSAPNYFAGNVLVGATTTQRPIEIAGAGSAGSINALHVEGTGSNYSGATFVRNDPTTAVLGSTINLGRTRGANAGDVTVVQNGDTLGGIAFFGADGTDIRTNAAHILAQVDGTPGANDMPGRLIFATTADGAAVPTERMRIDAAGNVGIGTAAPNFLGTGTALTVLGSATNRALVELGSTTATASGVFAQLSGYNGSATLASAIQFAGGGLSDSGDIRLFTKTSGSGIVERMRLDSAGNVGVGTNNPGTKLHVSSAGTVISKVENTTAGIVIQSGADSSVGFIGTYTNHPFVISTNSAERMRIDSAGNLGLGVTTLSPWAGGNSAIQLGGSSHLAGTSSLTQSVNYYYDGANKYVGAGAASRYVQSAGAHTWSTATSVGSAAGNPIAWVQQMTLDASGNVGVGVAPSAWKSNYTAIEQKYGISLVATDSAHATLTQNCYIDSAGGWIHKAPGPSTAMAMQLTNAQGFKVYEAAAAVAGTAATMVQTLAVQKDKTLALQGATSQTGAGLSFPATQVASTDANTLDDYEEGTWTPGITFGGSSVGVTFGGANGIYTKIGRVVYIAGLITLTSKGGLSGAALINGLPFTVGNSLVGTSIAGVMGALCLSGGTSVSDFELCPIASTATITPYNYTGGAATQIVAADITDAWAIRFSGYYAV